MMSFLQSLSDTITHTLEQLVEKNHRTALVNRIRLVIKSESENTSRLYEELGRYYFDHLRDPENKSTERLCKEIEGHEARIRRAFNKMAEIAEEAQASKESAKNPVSACAACSCCSDTCSCADDTDPEISMPEPAEPYSESAAEPAAENTVFFGAQKGIESEEAADDEQ